MLPSHAKFAFVSTMSNSPWGGSECLWSEAALELCKQGHAVHASVCSWNEPAEQLTTLRRAGIQVTERWCDFSHMPSRIFRKACREIANAATPLAFERWLRRVDPDLVCISNGCVADDVRLINSCRKCNVGYTLIVHANSESMWPDDYTAGQWIDAFQNSRHTFFVARGNKELLEVQLGIKLGNASYVWNPHSVVNQRSTPWPSEDDGIRLACVGRLHSRSKGQDLLLRVLALEQWKSRNVRVSFFGEGVNENCLRRLATTLDLSHRIEFRGHVRDVASIWADHHLLVLPSRYEGLPISLVEAMVSHRPAIVTDVGGNAEIVDDGLTGFVAPAPTVHYLADAMERAWRARERWKCMGNAAAAKMEALVPPNPAAAFASSLLELSHPKYQAHARAPQEASEAQCPSLVDEHPGPPR